MCNDKHIIIICIGFYLLGLFTSNIILSILIINIDKLIKYIKKCI